VLANSDDWGFLLDSRYRRLVVELTFGLL
jgi:hypothetical protein